MNLVYKFVFNIRMEFILSCYFKRSESWILIFLIFERVVEFNLLLNIGTDSRENLVRNVSWYLHE